MMKLNGFSYEESHDIHIIHVRLHGKRIAYTHIRILVHIYRATCMQMIKESAKWKMLHFHSFAFPLTSLHLCLFTFFSFLPFPSLFFLALFVHLVHMVGALCFEKKNIFLRTIFQG